MYSGKTPYIEQEKPVGLRVLEAFGSEHTHCQIMRQTC